MGIPPPVLLLVLGAASSARADTTAEDGRVVDVVVAATPEEAAGLEEVLVELLGRFGVALRLERIDGLDPGVVVTPDPSAPPAVARAWIDLGGTPGPNGARQATLYLADGTWERIRVRHVALDLGVDEVVREELAHMLASGVEGILAGRPLEQTREEVRIELGLPVSEPAPPPAAEVSEVPPELPAPRPRSLAFDLGVGYDVSGFADEAPASHGPLVALGLALRAVPLRPGLWLTLQYRLPVEAEAVPIGAQLDQGVFRLLASIDVPLLSGFALTVLLGGGLDVARTTPRLAAGETGRLEAASTAVFGVMRAVVGLRVRLFGATALEFAVGCDVDGQQRTYVARLDGAKHAILEPWIVRPLAMLTLLTDLLAFGETEESTAE